MVPFLGPLLIRRQRRRGKPNGLLGLRYIYIGLVTALPLYAYFLIFIIDRDRWFATDRAAVASVVVLGGLVSLALVRWTRNKPLDARDSGTLFRSYRASFLLGIGFSEAPALIAFVLTFVTSTLWIYLLGLAFSLVGFTLIGPSRWNIERRQEQITSMGSPVSLGAALVEGGGRGNT